MPKKKRIFFNVWRNDCQMKDAALWADERFAKDMKIPKRILRKFKRWRKAQEKAVRMQLDIDQWCLKNNIRFNTSIPHGIGWSISPKEAMNRQIKEIEDFLNKR